jgi:mono/diheme cytochrome c family protein
MGKNVGEKDKRPVVLTKTELLPPTDEEGEIIYKSQCLSCHQADGSGVPNMYPPIRESDWVNGDKTKLINVLLKGLQGEIEVNGDYYNQSMPKHDSLTDVQIAQVLTYIRKNFGNNSGAINPADVKKLRITK